MKREPNALAKNIRYLRKLKGWTQQDLAKRLGCSQALVASYEAGKRQPLTEKLTKLTELFGVTYDQIYGLKGMRTSGMPKNNKLWKRFEEASKLPPHEKTVLIKMIDGLLEQNKKSEQ